MFCAVKCNFLPSFSLFRLQSFSDHTYLFSTLAARYSRRRQVIVVTSVGNITMGSVIFFDQSDLSV
jgi:hypothetical protein